MHTQYGCKHADTVWMQACRCNADASMQTLYLEQKINRELLYCANTNKPDSSSPNLCTKSCPALDSWGAAAEASKASKDACIVHGSYQYTQHG